MVAESESGIQQNSNSKILECPNFEMSEKKNSRAEKRERWVFKTPAGDKQTPAADEMLGIGTLKMPIKIKNVKLDGRQWENF